jgi:hypothetical protein
MRMIWNIDLCGIVRAGRDLSLRDVKQKMPQ